MDRYPTIFSAVSSYAQKQSHPIRILSFGCSSGEEVLTLDSKYLQNADIHGVDIDQDALNSARKLQFSENNTVAFHHSSDPDWKHLSFDVVLALSVLCRWPETRRMENINGIYPFEQFAKQARELGSLVRRGGLLVIHNSSYYFEDTSAYREWFRPLHLEISNIGEVKRFDNSGNAFVNTRPAANIFQRI